MRQLRIRRKGFNRGPYTKKDGTHVKRHWVPPTTFMGPDIGLPGRGRKVVIIERKGALTKLGYSTSKSDRERREALDKAVKRFGASDVWHMLHGQVVLRKRTQPKARAVFEEDREYIKRKYKPDIAKPARREWMRMSPAARAKAMPGGPSRGKRKKRKRRKR